MTQWIVLVDELTAAWTVEQDDVLLHFSRAASSGSVERQISLPLNWAGFILSHIPENAVQPYQH